MFYVYILQSEKDLSLYAGITENVEQRLEEHNSGESPFTKPRRPYKLIFYEAYLNENDAMRRENYFKSTKGKIVLRQMLKEYFSNINK